MQIREFEALTLKDCLQQVRSAMGPEAVILETRKLRKGGLMGFGARDAIVIVAATGITVTSDLQGERPIAPRQGNQATIAQSSAHRSASRITETEPVPARPAASARLAARGVYSPRSKDRDDDRPSASNPSSVPAEEDAYAALLAPAANKSVPDRGWRPNSSSKASMPVKVPSQPVPPLSAPAAPTGASWMEAPAAVPAQASEARFTYLERAMGEIRECLVSLQREQREGHERTVSAVVSAVAPAVTAVNAAGFAAYADDLQPRFPGIQSRLREMGVSDGLIQELFDQLPDMGAWSEQAREPLAISALKDLIARRVSSHGPIELTPGRLKAVALIGSTGVGKTTTIAKLAAHFALMQGKRVALLTVDTYRIAAVEQLKTYSQIIGLPVSVAYNHAEVPPILEQYADYDLLLIDTAGRSQKHIMQVGELKSLLETVNCETHLVLSAQIKEQDMLEAARRFSAARVDRIIFSKLDETSSYGTLLNVADQSGIPLSYLTTGQKVPEDLEVAEGSKLASLILD